MRRALRSSAAALTAISALLLSGCGGDSGTENVFGAGGWPGMHSDARNSDTSAETGSRSLDFSWSRPIGGPTPTRATVAASGQIFITSQAEQGCNLLSFQIDSGRKRWCNRIGPGAAASSPVVDGSTNVYVGEEGAMSSFNEHGQLRWRTPVTGTPLSAQFTGDGNLLFVTQLGQINVLDPQTGFKVVPSYDLIPPASWTQGSNIEPVPNGLGLDQCFDGASPCPVSSSPALDLSSGRFVFTFWRPGAPQADLVAMRYTGGGDPKIEEDWSTSTLPDGSPSSPVLSADGKTVYGNDNAGHLWAVDAESGTPKWSHDLGYRALGGPSVSADGLIVPAGGEKGRLLALRDRGDRAEVAWERGDLLQVGSPAQTAGATGYTVVRDGDGGITLLTFDTRTGETLDQDALPGGTGFTAGTSIGPDGEVLTPTLIGELFVLK
ncbi:PQQ-binding-like beta-propeller repeat protein [Prescottella agglutinans]|uniref:Outer membrane protein assembly factor BamB n=1 Tax=Prescottella agglutinans TaxID=1644129 RepID=A0ABT6ME87_9NOCA|nr:PQQ-binding-like beta-propeller repeat protein [Prescottella agglutinans]MDH6282096.1 outer membrane protein assembly factor BamB [Prescottella agglutinans]